MAQHTYRKEAKVYAAEVARIGFSTVEGLVRMVVLLFIEHTMQASQGVSLWQTLHRAAAVELQCQKKTKSCLLLAQRRCVLYLAVYLQAVVLFPQR
jgi:hypothetical protein